MNYLAPLSAAAARLSAQLPPTLPVRVAVDADRARDLSIGQPEVWVLFNRDTVSADAGDEVALNYEVAVVYVTPGTLPDLERDGEALTAITKALQGYTARAQKLTSFQRVGSMVPQAWGDTMTAYGMLFSTSFVL